MTRGEEDKIAQWVKVSILLDLWQDEEGTLVGSDRDQLAGELALVEKGIEAWLRPPLPPATDMQTFPGLLRLDDAAFPSVANLRRLFKRLGHEEGAPEGCWQRFILLKAARVKTNLCYDRIAAGYASAKGKADAKNVVTAARDRQELLDWLSGTCLAALSATRENALETGTGDDVASRLWEVLGALFLSEVCASATMELSLAHAKQSRGLAPLSGPDWSELFEDVARHNVARGENHRKNPRETVVLLEKWLDRKRLGYRPETAGSSTPGVEAVPEFLKVRCVVLPGILTIADALESLRRLSEALWYLQSGAELAATVKSNYWQRTFELTRQLYGDDCVDAGQNEGTLANCPRLGRLRIQAEHSSLEHRLLEAVLSGSGDEVRRLLPLWVGAVRSSLRWHIGDPENFLMRLENTARALSRMGEAAQRVEANVLPGLTEDAQPLVLSQLVVEAASRNGRFDQTLKYLAGKRTDPPHERERRTFWRVCSALLDAWYEVKETGNLKEWLGGEDAWSRWLRDLRNRLVGAAPIISDTVSQAQLIKYLRWLPGKLPDCPLRCAEPSKCLSKHDRGCAADCLMMPSDESMASYEHYLSTMAFNASRFRTYLECRTAELVVGSSDSPVTPPSELIVLRRWNSFSPNLNSLSSATVGGGYLLRFWTSEGGGARYVGIAVDPGYNFLHNLFGEGFTVADIDIIVITHAHPDHTDNISNFLTLLREQKKRAKDKRIRARGSPVTIVTTEAVHDRILDLLKNEEEFVRNVTVVSWELPADIRGTHGPKGRGNEAGRNPVLLHRDSADCIHARLGTPREETCGRKDIGICLTAIPAFHDDGTLGDSMGIMVKASFGGNEVRVAILSDTRYLPSIAGVLSRCQVVVTHIGAVIGERLYEGYDEKTVPVRLISKHLHGVHTCVENTSKCVQKALKEEVFDKKNHLYLPGMTALLCRLQVLAKQNGTPIPLLLLSEFGEEMRGGLRIDLARRLRHLSPELQLLPADVGMRVDVSMRRTRCGICRQYVESGRIDPVVVSPADEAILYVCWDCKTARAWELPALLDRIRTQPKLLHPLPTRKD